MDYMKRHAIISFVLITFLATNCGNRTKNLSATSGNGTDQTGNAVLTFKEYEHDFGKIAEGEKVAYVFTFENSGDGNLVISSATTSCGCTVPKYDSRPIPPGKNGNLEVVFDTSGRSGMQTKTITVKSNASKPVLLLKITAEVITNSD